MLCKVPLILEHDSVIMLLRCKSQFLDVKVLEFQKSSFLANFAHLPQLGVFQARMGSECGWMSFVAN